MDGKAIDIFSHPTPAGLMTNSIDGKNMPELKYLPNNGPISLKVHPKGNSNKSEFAMYQLTTEFKFPHRIQAIRAYLEDKSEMLIIPPIPVVSYNYKKVDKWAAISIYEISNKVSDQPVHMPSLIRVFGSH